MTTLKERQDRIRLPQTAIVAATGLDKMTVLRVLHGNIDPRRSTLRKIEAALTAEELALRDYLLALHPLPVRHLEAAE